ncbi:MAG TPA: hypothetical protein VFA33_18460 [Bryobacteraceae bacterium]|nr:hypothetical protein [Bryobacteraceae bacterium]
MLAIRTQQMQSMADATPGTPLIVPCDPAWIEVRLVDMENRPVAGEKYRVRLPDLSIREGSLDGDGKVRLEGILAGQCQVCFPNLDSREWRSP